MKRTALLAVSLAALAAYGVSAAEPELGPYSLPPADAKFSEWDFPRNIYVTGDPMLLTKDNMNAPGERVTFISCPFIRDSDPTPLWLTEHRGETYFLRAQQNGTGQVRHPQLKHKVLVEGFVSKEPRVAGGVVLSPLNISVLPELDDTCNQFLPADGSKVAFAKRKPGPGGDWVAHRAQTMGRRAASARLWAADYKPDPVERITREFIVRYGFDEEMLNSYGTVVQAVKYARDVQASKVEIVGYRGSVKLSDGQVLVEKAGLEAHRAKNVEAVFHDYPVAREIVKTRWESKPRPADGKTDFANRYVSVIVTPGPAPKAEQTAARN